MTSTIRTRLWVSYSVIIITLICSVACGLFFTLRNSSLLYRAEILRIRVAEAALTEKLNNETGYQNSEVLSTLEEEASKRQMRILLLDSDGAILFDSETAVADLGTIPVTKDNISASSLVLPTIKDSKGNNWFYSLKSLDTGDYLVVAARKVRLPFRIFMRDELFGPLLISSGIALLVAIVFGFGLSRWIIKPIKKMIASSQELAEGKQLVIPVEGPGELQKLASSLNRMGEKVSASNQSQKEFLANITHELKTPLTSIQGFAQSIADGTAANGMEIKKAAGVIYEEAARMNRLVLDLLTLSRLEAGLADLKKTPVDLNLLIANVIEKFQIQARNSKIDLFQEGVELPRIMGDGDRLAQVLTNILDNSIKCSPGGGKVTIKSRVSKGELEILIVDTGIGIALENREKIFDRFFQDDRSRQGGSGRGIGLGLPIARQIVRAHGGEIRVESELGKGSTFIISLPLSLPTDTTMNSQKIIK